MPPHLKDKNQEETFFWEEGGVRTKATSPCEQRAYCLIERKVFKLALETRNWWVQHCANFFLEMVWIFTVVTFINKSYVRNRISEHLTTGNALMQLCLVLNEGI